MISRRRLLTPAALALGGSLVGGRAGAQGEDAPADAFRGKFLSVLKKSDPSYSISLEAVQIRPVGSVGFLVGVGADDGVPDNWQIGLTVWIALDDVSEITVFETLDDLRAAMNGLDLKVARQGPGR